MWTLKEIETEMNLGRCKPKLTESQIEEKCKAENIQMKIYYGDRGRVRLGLGISDEDCLRLFGLA